MKKTKGEIMNIKKVIGYSALAGSLVATSAYAVDMTVSGSAKVTYMNGNTDEVTGNPYGMNTSLAFTGSGDVNGYETTLTIVNNDANSGLSSAVLSVDLGDMGKLSFDQGTGIGGISTIDDKTPSAYEEVWDRLDAVTGTSNGLVGGGNSGAFVYSNSFMDMNLTAQYTKGAVANNSDDAVGSGGTGGTSWDFALTNQSLVDGLDVGAGYGKIANGTGANQDSDTDEHMVGYVNYSMGMVTVGYTEAVISRGDAGGTSEEAKGWAIAANLMDGLSVSYGEREVEYQHASAAHVTEDMDGYAIAYTMGAAKIALQQNETANNGGTSGNSDENTEIALSLSF